MLSPNDIVVRNLCYGQGKTEILREVNLYLPVGSMYGLLGPSGAGKTTFLRCLIGCVRPEFGDITMFGCKAGDSRLEIPGRNLGYMPQEIALYLDLTIGECLIYYGRLFCLQSSTLRDRRRQLITMLDLPEKTRLVRDLSGGQQRRVSFASTLIHRPKLIILDEPTAGVDPLLREKIWQFLVMLTETEKVTVIITTHYIEEARRANRIGFMRKGRIIIEDEPEKLLTKYRLTTLEDVFLELCSIKRKSTLINADCVREFEKRRVRSASIAVYPSPIKADNTTSKQAPFTTCNPLLTWLTVFFTLVWKNILQDIRNPLTMSLQYLNPIYQILLFAVCIGRTPFDIRIGVVNDDYSVLSFSDRFLSHINPKIVQLIEYRNITRAMSDTIKRRNWAVIHIPRYYSYGFLYRTRDNVTDEQVRQSKIIVHADMSDKIVAMTTYRSLQAYYIDYVCDQYRLAGLDRRRGDPYVKIVDPIYGTNKRDDYSGYRDFMMPGMIMNLTFALSIAVTSMILLAEKNAQTFERNMSCGISARQMLLAHILVRILLSAPYALVIVYLPLWLFSVAGLSRAWMASMMVFTVNVVGMCAGILFSSLCRSLMMVMFGVSGIFIVGIFISGAIWPLEAIPLHFRWVSIVQPMTYATEAYRAIVYKNWGFCDKTVYLAFGICAVWIVFLFALGSRFFYRK